MDKAGTELKIKSLIEKMTIEEKIGQLHLAGPSLVGAFEVDFEELVNMVFDGRITKAELDEMMSSANQDYHEDDIRAGRIGSFNGINNAETAIRLQKIAVEESRLGIPLLYGYDVIHGYRTVTPIPLAESCSWDPKLWEQTARISAIEASSSGVHLTYAPMVDVSKDARWGRVSEGAGEDTLLNSLYGIAKVKGYQTDDLTDINSLAACVKHFAAYGAAESGRDYNRVEISTQRFFEEYLPPFEACIKAGARAIMPAFNDINGVPCSVNNWLLNDILRKSWGFDGMTISDANAIAECVNHGVAIDNADAAEQSINAGMDMDMSSNCFRDNLLELLQKNRVSEETLNQAVANVLRLKFELGLFENPYRTSVELEAKNTLRDDFRDLARKAAVNSMVLLKNEGILPFDLETKIGVVGPLADNRGEMTGTWAVRAVADDCVSLVDGCKQNKIDYLYTPGIEKNSEEATGWIVNKSKIADLSSNCDVIIVAVGENKGQSGEAASRANIGLPQEHIQLLQAALDTGKPVIAVLFNGRPLAIKWLQENIPAIIEAWHPGVEAGNALIDIMFGKSNPSAKLTTTFPYASGQCPIYYNHVNTGRPGGRGKFTSKYLDTPLEPLYPFGFGLSYTKYDYSDLHIAGKNNSIEVSVVVKNSGDMAGAEITQCYLHDLVAQRVRPVKQLVDFQKTFLKPGETRKITFTIPHNKLAYYDKNMNYITEDGDFEIFVGSSSVSGLSGIYRLDIV